MRAQSEGPERRGGPFSRFVGPLTFLASKETVDLTGNHTLAYMTIELTVNVVEDLISARKVATKQKSSVV